MSAREFELKFELAPSTPLRRLQSISAGRPKRTNETSVYFDTKEHTLHTRGLMLRVRQMGRRHIQTLTAAPGSALFERDEWEAELPDSKPDLSRIGGKPLRKLVKQDVCRQLVPLFETRITRTTFPLAGPKGIIDLTVDRGQIRSPVGQADIYELELELKQGNKQQLFDLARKITRTIPARLALISKSDRGYELVDGKRDAPVKAQRVDVSPQSKARDAFKRIGFACLQQILANVGPLVKEDPEGVHQMRVGVRRLRAAMSVFKDLLSDSQTAPLKRELRWLAGELTQAREFEVLKERVIAPMKQSDRDGMPVFSRQLIDKSDTALRRAKKAVESARFRVLALELAAWFEVGLQTRPKGNRVKSLGHMPVKELAGEELQRRWRKVRKRGKGFEKLNPGDQHKLRIQVKKLRYAAEFFGDLFQSKKAIRRQKKFVAALEHLQDGLGELNDIIVDEHLLETAGTRTGEASRTAFAAGLLAGREDARQQAAMTAAVEGYAALAKAKPFW